MSSANHPTRFIPRPPSRLAEATRIRKHYDLEWFHLITSEMDEAGVRLACLQLGLGEPGASMRDLQTLLLQLDGERRRRWLEQRAKFKQAEAQVPQKVR